jgi:AcrR family transcriptional regulator
VREEILQAADELLREASPDDRSVADILRVSGVSRASFYFYFESKHEVLAELVRRAVDIGRIAAQPWVDLGPDDDPEPAVRQAILDGARLWQQQAHVLRTIVENWQRDPTLTELWTDLMASYTATTTDKIRADQRVGLVRRDLDAYNVAASLTWLGERLYYLASIDVPPFDHQPTLVDTMTSIWMSTVYGGTSS